MNEIQLTPTQEMLRAVTRRHFFRQAGFGIGGAALSSLINKSLAGSTANPLAPKPPLFPAKARSIIYLFMAGAPSQVDLLDCKPKLQQLDGQDCPDDLLKGERFAFIVGKPRLLGSPYTFKRAGKSGAEISEVLPHLAEIADDVAILKSLQTTQFNHAPGQMFMNTGFQFFGRPSMGSWLTYGLGSEASDLPGFVVLLSGENEPDGGKACWGSGFLPTVYQGVQFRSGADPVLFLTNPDGVSPELAASVSRCSEGHERDAPEERRRSGDTHAHRFLRDGLPDAVERAGVNGYFERAGSHAPDVWCRAG